jgi:hypothetical protein
MSTVFNINEKIPRQPVSVAIFMLRSFVGA